MSERMNVLTVASDEVQGPGSWVKLRKILYGRQLEAQKMITQLSGGTMPKDLSEMRVTMDFLDRNDAYTRQLLAECVVAWNWVDDAGAPLPAPAESESVIDQLTDDEIKFLVRALQRPAADTKN